MYLNILDAFIILWSIRSIPPVLPESFTPSLLIWWCGQWCLPVHAATKCEYFKIEWLTDIRNDNGIRHLWINASMQLHYRMYVLFSYIASWPHQIQDYTFYGLWHAVLFTIPMCLLLPWYSLSLVKQMQYIFINLISLKFIVNITQHRPVLIQKSHTNTVTFILAPHWWLLYPNIPP